MNSLKLLRLPFWNIVKNKDYVTKLAKYGNTFTNFDNEKCRINQWPQPGWRKVVDGLSGGDNTTTGEFTLEWKDNRHYATNSAVADGDYCFTWNNLDVALKDSLYKRTLPETNTTFNNNLFLFEEINYHACGSQLFYSNDNPIILLLAKPSENRNNDDILPEDFETFLIPAGLGVHIDAYVWHSPPILPNYDKTIVVKTKQSKINSKIYYNPLTEHNTLLYIQV